MHNTDTDFTDKVVFVDCDCWYENNFGVSADRERVACEEAFGEDRFVFLSILEATSVFFSGNPLEKPPALVLVSDRCAQTLYGRDVAEKIAERHSSLFPVIAFWDAHSKQDPNAVFAEIPLASETRTALEHPEMKKLLGPFLIERPATTMVRPIPQAVPQA